MLTELMSVSGPVAPADLGVTMPHEHTFLDTMREHRGDGLVSDAALVTEELLEYRALGGRSIVDCTSRGLRPQPALVRQVSEASGVTIILGTGFYRHPFLDEDWFDRHSTDEVADLIVRDIREGIDGSSVRAGVIGEVGCDRFLTPAEERSFRAAARAHHETGLTITTHAARWADVGVRQLDLLESEGVTPQRVIVGHCDMVPDMDAHAALAERGAWVQFDSIGGEAPYRTRWLMGAIRRLDEAGFADRLLLSQDICLTSQMRAFGGPGYGYILRELRPLLHAEGLGDAWIERVLVDNPARALSGA
jgi:predicted metal-dependent phosphotriesterase family hydrolase